MGHSLAVRARVLRRRHTSPHLQDPHARQHSVRSTACFADAGQPDVHCRRRRVLAASGATVTGSQGARRGDSRCAHRRDLPVARRGRVMVGRASDPPIDTHQMNTRRGPMACGQSDWLLSNSLRGYQRRALRPDPALFESWPTSGRPGPTSVVRAILSSHSCLDTI